MGNTIVWRLLSLPLFVIAVFCSSMSFGLEGYDVYRLSPLDNIQKKTPRLLGMISEPSDQALFYSLSLGPKLATGAAISVTILPGETRFIDLVVEKATPDAIVNLRVVTPGSNLRASISKVQSWQQAGVYETKLKVYDVQTFELISNVDVFSRDLGSWKSAGELGDKIYIPPPIAHRAPLAIWWQQGHKQRLLIKLSVDETAKQQDISASVIIAEKGKLGTLNFDISILGGAIDSDIYSPYKVWLFTSLAIDPLVGRKGSYLNSMRLHGDSEQREIILRRYLADIRNHGFTGVTIQDWRPAYIEKHLEAAKEVGLSDVVVHSVGPKFVREVKEKYYPISEEVVSIIKRYGFEPFFYGYDEVGGNKRSAEQIELNVKIHKSNAKSVNALFWDDRAQFIQANGGNQFKNMDVVAHSMGSHGFKEFFSALPLPPRNDDTAVLAYWHPHVEMPIRNRLFSGYWLWASGLDGVIPHGYFFPPHYAKYKKANDNPGGAEPSPFDDDTYWLPPGNLRHHATIYPSYDGPIPTLQWEAFIQGANDLKFILTVQKLLNEGSLSSVDKQLAIKLIATIREETLKIKSVYFKQSEQKRYMRLTNQWRDSLRELIANK